MITSLFIDDIRNPPADGREWIVKRDSRSAIQYLMYCIYPINHISFDHDLGGDDTAREVVKWMLEQELDNTLTLADNWTWTVHSANPVGKQWLTLALLDLEKLRYDKRKVQEKYCAQE